ncbi:MAG: hypothetical protein HMLKMBBP_04012 [Planctomycetes bacterium]|nr:hypothetical protein [Planctomycetota bacterium]
MNRKNTTTTRSGVRGAAARAAAGGIVLSVGAVIGVTAGALLPTGGAGTADAGEVNYVRSASHDAISGVRLDEEVAVNFNAAVLPTSVGPDTILIRTGPTAGEQANGTYEIGRFLYDRALQRRVVVAPEMIQLYYQLTKPDRGRVWASQQTARTIQNIERTGRFKVLDKMDTTLVTRLGIGQQAGTRLDQPETFVTYPPPQQPTADEDIRRFREKIAGEDALWQDYLVNGNFNAFASLAANPEYERFFHPINPATGVADDRSVLRDRQYRRVLIDRRGGTRVMFVPEVPIRPDIADTGYRPGVAYSVVVPSGQPGVFNTVLTRAGRRPLMQSGGRDFSTLFTTVPAAGANAQLFASNEAAAGLNTWQTPRIINVTPPNGETFIDQTTDWEDPDDQSQVPLSARKPFTIRVRFAQPLDPRTVNSTSITLTKTRTNPSAPGGGTAVAVPVAVGTFLSQKRLGIVEIEVTPSTNLDPASQYTLQVDGSVASLHGERLDSGGGGAYEMSFIVGPGEPPQDKIQEKFASAANRAAPTDPTTLGQVTTAHWPTPAYLNPLAGGQLTASFMPWSGTGVGANMDPLDITSPIITDFVLNAGEQITFPTEGLDPSGPNFGSQIEYHYRSITMNSGTVRTLGSFPLVFRCQGAVSISGTTIFANGAAGEDGLTNTDTVTGQPTGGIGGRAGPGGYAGGDGASAPLTDAAGNPILDGLGAEQFDQTKFNGLDGKPSYLAAVGSSGGGGSGGGSGDVDATNTVDSNLDGSINANDNPTQPARCREAGGGGGHGTAGANGARAGFKAVPKAGGFFGGVGGLTYGSSVFSDQPLNAQGAPVLTRGAGGAGGGGGGSEDDAPLDTAGPEDSGGGGGGGGGGGVQICARGDITLSSSIIDVSGGLGGRTYNAAQTATGQGAPGGCGAGGAIWLSSFGNIVITNGSLLNAGGGIPGASDSIGQVAISAGNTPIEGQGGIGGDGFIVLEDSDGIVDESDAGSQAVGVLTKQEFNVESDGSYPNRGANDVMVTNVSTAFSRWFDSQLDTPTYFPLLDNLLTPELDGTEVSVNGVVTGDFGENGTVVLIECRAADGSTANPGIPNTAQTTSWVPIQDVGTISDRRFLQFRVTFTLPLSYSFDDPRPYVRCLTVDVELN